MSNWEKILEKTILVREFEKIIQSLYFTDCIQSPVHLSIGQELISVLMSEFYEDGDHLVGNYRSHALAISIADDYEPIILELLAKKEGVSSGKAGSMHLSVPNKNLMWTSAIVGTGVPVATGIAESLKRLTKNNVVSVMLGDGAIEEGCVLESLNISSVFKLPIVFILEDNGLAIHTRKEKRTSLKSYSDLAKTYKIKTFSSTLKKPYELLKIFHNAYKYSREKRRPVFVEIECFRWIEHVGVNFDWDLGYRSESELDEWKKYDIINSPEIIHINKKFVKNKSNFFNKMFSDMFEKCSNYPFPEKSDLLENVI